MEWIEQLANKVFNCSSGIGRSVAALFAKEGADVTIVYLTVEEDDAQGTKKLVEAEGKKCLLIAGDLRDRNFCKKAVEKHIEQYVSSS
jgi:NAD(P)-dependent dehydrogenase (short-subunit alcohol dehydrogenase family)